MSVILYDSVLEMNCSETNKYINQSQVNINLMEMLYLGQCGSILTLLFEQCLLGLAKFWKLSTIQKPA